MTHAEKWAIEILRVLGLLADDEEPDPLDTDYLALCNKVRDIQADTMKQWAKIGGMKGGAARARKLSPKRRKEIAVTAANVRWAKREAK